MTRYLSVEIVEVLASLSESTAPWARIASSSWRIVGGGRVF